MTKLAARLAVALAAACLAVAADAADDLPVGGTHVGTTLFLDATHVDQSTHGQHDSAASGSGIDLKRLYFILDHRFSEVWSAHLLTDVNWLRHGDPTRLWVKNAYLEGAFTSAFTLRMGAAPTPWVPLANHWYGYRYVEKDLVMRAKFGTPADWGIHALGSLGANHEIEYAVSVVTGAGFKEPRLGNGADVEARVAWHPVKQMIVALGGYEGTLAQDVDGLAKLHTARRVDAMVAWAGENWRLGGEYYHARDWNNVTSPAGDTSHGWSVWCSVQLGPRVALFARHDHTAPSADLDPARHDRYSNLGVEWRARKWLKLAAVYKRERLLLSGTDLKTINEVGVWSQVSF